MEITSFQNEKTTCQSWQMVLVGFWKQAFSAQIVIIPLVDTVA
jgi:hypothetical protein